MKHGRSKQKSRTRAPRSSMPDRDRSHTLQPPSYGIDFVDDVASRRGAASEASVAPSSGRPSLADPHSVRAALGEGQPLDSRVRAQMESAYGRDFSAVRVHTDGAAAELASRANARAFTVGADIVMRADHYQPGNLAGNILLAHELAHVAQQEDAARSPLAGRGSGSDKALEKDADRSVWGALASVGRGITQRASSWFQKAKPTMRTGLRLQRCPITGGGEQLQAPSFLGPHSRETLETINRRVESAGLLQDMLVVGPLIVLFTSSPLETGATGGYPLEEQVRAVDAVPTILRNRVLQDIDLLLLMHGNELTEEERAYWNRIRNAFD